MSYDPSHRRPPRQERWPSATPAEGWPPYRDGERADGRYEADRQGGYQAARHQAGYRRAIGGSGDRGYPPPVSVTDDFQPAQNGYGAATSGGYPAGGYPAGSYQTGGYRTGSYPGGGGYAADDFDGAPGGYGWADGGYETTAGGYLGPGSYTEYNEPRPDGPRLVAPDAGVHPDTWQAEQDSRREASQRGMAVGAVTEILGVAVAIGVSTLAAGLLKAQTSPVAAMGSVFIDRTPATLRNALVHHFGPHGQAVLLLVMYAAIAFAALVVGALARRAAAVGVAGLAAFTLLAAFAVITRPTSHVGDVTPVVVGGVAGAAALLWLVRASAPIAPLRPVRGGARRSTR